MKIQKYIGPILSHLMLILAICIMAFIVLDWYNPLMGFLTNPVSVKILMIFCATAAANAIIYIRTMSMLQ